MTNKIFSQNENKNLITKIIRKKYENKTDKLQELFEIVSFIAFISLSILAFFLSSFSLFYLLIFIPAVAFPITCYIFFNKLKQNEISSFKKNKTNNNLLNNENQSTLIEKINNIKSTQLNESDQINKK